MDGRDLFEFYCATCHGRDGRGRGPTASALKTPPADLTKIAARNGGTFPRARVAGLVTGDDVLGTPAHGSREMPVWGPIFHALDSSETVNKVRIANIVDHLQSIQQPR
jgi:mono/diheme cytochrome c family protein